MRCDLQEEVVGGERDVVCPATSRGSEVLNTNTSMWMNDHLHSTLLGSLIVIYPVDRLILR